MAKSRQEKIANYDERIAQLENQKKQEQQRLKADERKARTKRLCSRHGLLESMIPEIITITDEQYKAFLEKAVTNDYGRRILASVTAQGGNSTAKKPNIAQPQQSNNAAPQAPKSPPQANATPTAKSVQSPQGNAANANSAWSNGTGVRA